MTNSFDKKIETIEKLGQQGKFVQALAEIEVLEKEPSLNETQRIECTHLKCANIFRQGKPNS